MVHTKSEIAVIGLGTMGKALAQNLLSRGFYVAGYNRNFQKTESVETTNKQNWTACKSLEELIQTLESPRKIIMMLPAGDTIDDMLQKLLPLLEKGDILLDGGNSYFKDTQRRFDLLKNHNINYFGLGVSGGEEGALKGPSLMPSGDKKAYSLIKNYLESIAAVEKGQPCCAYLGSDGAGHYVKMVHNGIEYADMQLLAEVYLILKQIFKLTNKQISTIFEAWNKTELRSYLVEISSKVLLENYTDEKTGTKGQLIDFIVDSAGQKGTGSWTAIEALQSGQAVSLIDSAVQARIVSNQKTLRNKYSQNTLQVAKNNEIKEEDFNLEDYAWVKDAYYLSKRIAYAQGFALMHEASNYYNWNLDLGLIASIFRKGCIIQAQLLEDIMQSYAKEKMLEHLLLSHDWQENVQKLLPSLRKLVLTIVENGIPAPLINASLTYIDQLSSASLGANLIQAQRDFFGAHTFEMIGKEGKIHYEWNK